MRSSDKIPTAFKHPEALQDRIQEVLYDQVSCQALFPKGSIDSVEASSVLFLLGCQCDDACRSSETPCLILNKRSLKVKQPGDLCCPGGSIAPRLDHLLARFLTLPGTVLTRWQHWPDWRRHRKTPCRDLPLLFATGLREGFEEMRLNPFKVKFLGALPPEKLVMFRRVIYPLVCWVPRQQSFKTNWEVEKIVYIPLGELMNPANYARFQLKIDTDGTGDRNGQVRDFPCFLFQDQGQAERLWGATFRITMHFLKLLFGFQPPDIAALPTVEGQLGRNYLTGNS